LAAWVFLPLLALVVVWMVADATLPASDCDGVSEETSGFATYLVLAVVGAASLGTCAAAALRISASFRAGEELGPLAVAVIGCAIVLGAFLLPISGPPIVGMFFLGLPTTGLVLIALLVSLPSARAREHCAAMLPVYLLGCGLFAYPSVLFVFAIGNSGLGC
jgi:uncharacterized membrane protein YczE